MQHDRGFTIVELLIVIAILGIVASIILSSLNDARDQGLEAKIIAELEGIQTRAAIEESTTLNYHHVCGTGGNPQSVMIAELLASIGTIASSTPVCNGAADEYAVSAPVAGTDHWCVDSRGSSGVIAAPLASSTYQCL